MTATTLARSRNNPVKASENRDSSPSAAISQQRSDSSEEEPFDQRPSNNSNGNRETMRPYDNDEVDEVLEDGELPSLTLKPAKGRIVNGQRTTTRPLSPPSKAGTTFKGPVQEQQRQFWGQLDEDPEERERPSYDADGPDDEMAARQVTRRNDGASRQGDETGRRFKDVDVDMDESAISENYTFSTAVSLEEQEANFCAQTLTAFGEICGTGLTYKPSDTPPKRIQSKPLPKNKARREEVPLEEHTAIEVEFVEPSGAISPQRKNAYLTAMAKKAKDDFQKKKDKSKQGGADPEAPQEDIYNNFSAAEKRMFLKFINTGVSPSDASQRVTEERKLKDEKEKSKEKTKGEKEKETAEAEVEKALSPGRKSNFRGLAFWKKDKDGSPKTPRSKSTPPSKGESVVKESAPQATETVKAEIPAAAPSGSKERLPRAEERPSPTKAAAVVRSLSPKPSTPVSKTKTSPAATAAWSVSPRPSPPAKAQKSPAAVTARSLSPEPSTQANDGKANLVVTTADFSPPEPEPEHDIESDSDDGEYPKSGINYYDAVRRGHPDDEAEQFEDATSPQRGNNSSRAASGRNSTARAMKFSALRESRAKSAPRVRESEDQQASAPARPPLSAPARGNNGKQPENSFSSTPSTKVDSMQRNIAPENDSEVNMQMSSPYTFSVHYEKEQPKSSPRTVKTLINLETGDVNKSATSREEDAAALERIEQELLRPHKSSGASVNDGSGAVLPLPANKRDQKSKDDQTKPSSNIENTQGDRAPIGKIAGTSSPAIRSTSNSTTDTPQDSASATTRATSTPSPDYEPAPSVTRASNSQIEPFSRQKDDQRVEDQGMDVDIDVDAYLNSTDTYSVVSRDNDAMSVYTAGTGVTQSSRVRRPGAAQARLAKAKQAGGMTKNGWHESIRAAAVSTNRVWDPKLGWVDYEEPEDHMLDSGNEKIHIDLDKNALRRPKKDEGDSHLANTGGTGVPVPFPKEWERERDEMLHPVMEENVAQGPVVPETKRRAVDEVNSVTMQSEASPSKPKGWVESMRAASEALGKHGQTWDPDHGWTSADQRTSQTPDVVDFDAPVTFQGTSQTPDVVDFDAPVTYQGTSQTPDVVDFDAPVMYQGTSQTPDVVDFDASVTQRSSQTALLQATQPAEPSNNVYTEGQSRSVRLEPSPVAKSSIPTDPDAYYGSADESIFREPRALAIPLPPRDTDRKLNQWMEKSENAPKVRSELSTENSDKAVASAGTGATTEKYMQLGDTGSVRSQYQDVKSSGQPRRPNSAPDAKPSGQPPRPIGGPSVRVPIVTPRIETHETHEPSESEDDEAPLLQSSGSFPSMTDFSPTVGIVREKVSQEDMGWFPQDTTPTVGIVREKMSQEDMGFFPQESRERRQIHSTKAAASQGTVSSGSVSQSPSRRGAGPVDLDEVDETWESDDEKRRSDGWEANSYPIILTAKSEESQYTGSVTSLPTKPVPKLKSSKKDTSPIRGRKSNSSAAPAVMRGDSPGDTVPSRGTANVDQNKALSPSSREGNSFDSTGRTRQDDSFTSAAKPSDSPGVKARLEEWESRAVDAISPTEEEKNQGANAEWKSFLGKKVRAESAAAARQQGASGAREEYKEPEGDRWNRKTHIDSAASFVSAGGGRHAVETQEEDDSLFEFVSNPGNPTGERSSRVSREREREPKRSTSLERSDLSPIRAEGDDSDSDDDPVSEAYGPEANERMSFLKRLTECAAPMMPSSARAPTNSDSMPTAHLAFLRTNPQGSGSKQGGPSRFVPPGLCGRPDIIDEDEDAEDTVQREERKSAGQSESQLTESSEKPRSRSTPRGGSSRAGISTSSVISDDVGSKTAYFEAIAMRAAVSNPRRSESRRRDRSSGASSVTSGSSQHSEKWKAFLDRKNASGASPGASPLKSRASSSTETSKAAEKYAAGKVEEMMAKMAGRSNSASKTAREPDVSMDWPSVNTSGPSVNTTGPSVNITGPSINTSGESYGGERSKSNRSDSVSKAAEDLAAARVEAMMAALSSSHLDEGEI